MAVHNFEKQFHALRYFLYGRRYFMALQALELAAKLHRGTRKDGLTPELDHPITVTLFLATLEASMIYPEETLASALLHDVVEDYFPTTAQIENQFGSLVGKAVGLLTKAKDGVKRSPEEYFASMAEDPIASLGKGGDRIHNSQTMVGVFSYAKQREYMAETTQHILPMLKLARRRFPQQHAAYINLKFILVSQLEMLEAVHQNHKSG